MNDDYRGYSNYHAVSVSLTGLSGAWIIRFPFCAASQIFVETSPNYSDYHQM